jgi:hypothetical protein
MCCATCSSFCERLFSATVCGGHASAWGVPNAAAMCRYVLGGLFGGVGVVADASTQLGGANGTSCFGGGLFLSENQSAHAGSISGQLSSQPVAWVNLSAVGGEPSTSLNSSYPRHAGQLNVSTASLYARRVHTELAVDTNVHV